VRPTAPKLAKRSKSGPHAAKLNLSPYKTRTGGTLVCIAQTRENAPRGPVGRFTGILEHRKGNGAIGRLWYNNHRRMCSPAAPRWVSAMLARRGHQGADSRGKQWQVNKQRGN